MNGNPALPPSDPKNEGAAAASPAPAAPTPGAGELDLEVEEVRLPERMKEGFVGQER